MKPFLSLLILVISFGAAYGQPSGRLVFWSGDPGCGVKSKSVPVDDIISCNSISTDRGPVSSITHNGVTLSVVFLEEADYNIVGAGITNGTSESVFFDADMWGAAHFKTKADFHELQKPIRAETAIPTRDIIRVMATDVRQESSLDTFIADGAKTVETKEMRRSDGTRYRVDVIVPDKDTQQAVARQNAARTDMVMGAQRRIRETALTTKSVQPSHSVKGLVYFRRVKNADFVVFSLAVGGTTYVFQLPRVKK